MRIDLCDTNVKELSLGLDETQMVYVNENQKLHRVLLSPLTQLQEFAGKAGFELQVVSGYRGFDRQLAIWNAKAAGLRPVLDAQGQPMNIEVLSDEQLMFAILRWSALPGGSRHHWGSDFDVVDAGSIRDDYQVQLTVEETQGQGVFSEFHRWLDSTLVNESFGFYRPYQRDLGATAPEPWHLSYAPLADTVQRSLSLPAITELLVGSDIYLKDTILKHLPDIFDRYICMNASSTQR